MGVFVKILLLGVMLWLFLRRNPWLMKALKLYRDHAPPTSSVAAAPVERSRWQRMKRYVSWELLVFLLLLMGFGAMVIWW